MHDSRRRTDHATLGLIVMFLYREMGDISKDCPDYRRKYMELVDDSAENVFLERQIIDGGRDIRKDGLAPAAKTESK